MVSCVENKESVWCLVPPRQVFGEAEFLKYKEDLAELAAMWVNNSVSQVHTVSSCTEFELANAVIKIYMDKLETIYTVTACINIVIRK